MDGAYAVAPPPPAFISEGVQFKEVATNKVVGRIHQMNPKSLRATCKWDGHGKCLCWVSLKPPEDNEDGMARLRVDFEQWLADGKHSTEGQHHASSVALRRHYGMKIK